MRFNTHTHNIELTPDLRRRPVAPRGFPSAATAAATTPPEVFLDFDPVFPGWPPDRTGSRHATPPLEMLLPNGGAP